MRAKSPQKAPPARPKPLAYRQQFGVVVICTDEAAQRAVYEQLHAQGFKLRVVCV